jgi:hypothetical protein
MNDINYTDVRTQEMVENLLTAGETTVTFIKADGSERVMRCTLNETLIPFESAPKGETSRKKSDEVRPVYDLDAAGWRSFRWDSITEVSV